MGGEYVALQYGAEHFAARLPERRFAAFGLLMTATERCKDLSYRWLDQQLSAIGSGEFEVGIKTDDTMVRAVWTRDEIDRKYRYLRYCNAHGAHIYLRPNQVPAVILVDDLSSSAVSEMASDGLEPACVALTSPENYQAWVKVCGDRVSPDLGTTLGGLLVERYGGDPGSKSFRHLGRAVGFTNQKAEHRQADGRFPFVRLVSATGVTASRADELLRDAERIRFERECANRENRARRSNATRTGLAPAAAKFEQGVSYIASRFPNTDWSRAEASAAVHMLMRGYSADDVRDAMLNNADIQCRKQGHVEDYVERTVRWAERSVGTSRDVRALSDEETGN